MGVVPPGMALSTGVPPAALLLAPDGGSLGSHPPDDEDDRAAKRRRGLRWAIAATVVAALVALVLVLALTRPSSSGGGTVAVPSVAGQSEAAASATLRRAGLIPVPALTANASVPSGVVIGETPPAGSLVGRGTRVTIAVSTGPGSSALPNVVGLTAAQATAKLKQAGFKPTSETQSSTTVSSGQVISTDPTAGTELQAGSPVTVIVSGGPAQTTVPNVVGESRAAAEATLTNAKLAVGTVTQQTSSEHSAGHGARTVARRGLLAGGWRQGQPDDCAASPGSGRAKREGRSQGRGGVRARTRRLQAQGAVAQPPPNRRRRASCWNRARRVA